MASKPIEVIYSEPEDLDVAAPIENESVQARNLRHQLVAKAYQVASLANGERWTIGSLVVALDQGEIHGFVNAPLADRNLETQLDNCFVAYKLDDAGMGSMVASHFRLIFRAPDSQTVH